MTSHWKNWFFLSVALISVAALLILAPGEAQAAAGGVFSKALKSSPFLQILLGIAGIILLPLGLYVLGREQWKIFQTKRDLRALAEDYPYFAWSDIKAQAQAAFEAVYSKWQENDLEPARDFMIRDYFQSQQDMLDRWREEGKRNVVKLKSKPGFAPLSVMVEDETGFSTVWLRVTVNLVDYLEDVSTGKRLKGRKGTQRNFESIWMFGYSRGAWRLASIMEGNQTFNISKVKNRLDTGYIEQVSAQVAAPAAEPAEEMDEDAWEGKRGA